MTVLHLFDTVLKYFLLLKYFAELFSFSYEENRHANRKSTLSSKLYNSVDPLSRQRSHCVRTCVFASVRGLWTNGRRTDGIRRTRRGTERREGARLCLHSAVHCKEILEAVSDETRPEAAVLQREREAERAASAPSHPPCVSR